MLSRWRVTGRPGWHCFRPGLADRGAERDRTEKRIRDAVTAAAEIPSSVRAYAKPESAADDDTGWRPVAIADTPSRVRLREFEHD